MHFLTGKTIPRRTFVQGMGVTVTLPFLDAMVPSGLRGIAAMKANDRTRLVAIEMVHGAAGSNELGAKANMWSPAAAGSKFDLSPTAMTSLDQIYAQRFGQDNPIPSMQLCIEPVDQAGGCAYGYACVYTDSISWASPTEPLPIIRDPRVAFEKLFGVGGSSSDRAQRRQTRRSILDWVAGEITTMKGTLGPEDKIRLDRYLEDIREVERRIERTEARNKTGDPRELPGAPAGVPDAFADHVQLMFDLQALAFAADTTRVFSFKMGRDGSSRTYPESGTDKPFHPASHHGGREANVKDFQKINKYHVSMLPYFLDKLKSIQEGDSNMLDKTMIIYGSPMADSNLHSHRRCPLIVLGHANGQLAGNQHVIAPDGTPMANAMLSMMHKLGMNDIKQLGDSTEPLTLGSQVSN